MSKNYSDFNPGKLYFIVLALLLPLYAFPDKGKSLIKFAENKNQWDASVKYRAQLDGGALFLQGGKLLYHFYDKETYRSMHANPKAKPRPVRTHWFQVNFLN